VAATRLFAQRGYDGTSVQAVAADVGIRAPSLLYHFASKEQLRDAVLEGLLTRWKDIVPKLLIAATTGRDRFDAVIGEVIAFFQEEPMRARLLLREALDRPNEVQALVETHLAPWMSLLTEFIELGQREGRVHDDLDPEVYVSQVVVLILSHFSLGSVLGAALSQDQEHRRLTELRRLCNAALYRPRPGA
jgi:AcrR family transcriptional regulator